MKANIWARCVAVVLMAALAGVALPAWTQDRPSSNMEILREKIKADKKLLVAINMKLTESEAKGFWSVYDEYQKDLEKLNKRIGGLLRIYAKDYRNKTLTDAKAKKLIDEFLSIEQAEANLKGSYVPRLNKVLPAKKVARYLQIENKIRAIVRYDLAARVPLVK
ncbi:MAG: hypothetical protein ACE10F_09090, partial [Candidatus Methylomirabilales bacterium]|jgi:hypothetical protein|nr:hypothetical protein [candidate division NC10 bacterium]